jgi:hypothetical protein
MVGPNAALRSADSSAGLDAVAVDRSILRRGGSIEHPAGGRRGDLGARAARSQLQARRHYGNSINRCPDLQKDLAPAFTHQADETGLIRAVMAAETDMRMFVQQGCFTIHSNPTPLDELESSWDFLSLLSIPRADVPAFAEGISLCGFRQGDIFPDLGNLAAEMKKAYPPGWAGQ